MINVRWRGKLAGVLGVTLAAAGLAVLSTAHPAEAQSAGPHKAPSGDNGTVKIHRSTTPVTDRRNEPHVCVFYLDAFGFDPGQAVSWQIKSWPPTGNRTVVSSGTLSLDGSGDGHTGDMTLQDGHYKLFWNFNGEHGRAKQKVFWVKCASTTTPSPSPSVPSPSVPSPSVPSPSMMPSASPTAAPGAPSSVPPAQAPKPVSASLPVTG
jgi:hypothetical protein